MIQNIFLDESHSESQESVVINAKKLNSWENMTITIDLHFKRYLRCKNIFGCISLYDEKVKLPLNTL